jgi:hypothetical protein
MWESGWLRQRDVLGWRRKFGVMAPSTNTIVQPDFDDMRPVGVTNHYSRIFTPNTNVLINNTFRAGIDTIGSNVMDAIKSVMTCEPDSLVMGISALSFFGGVKGADAFAKRISDAFDASQCRGRSGCRVATDGEAEPRLVGRCSTYYLPQAGLLGATFRSRLAERRSPRPRSLLHCAYRKRSARIWRGVRQCPIWVTSGLMHRSKPLE